MNNRFLNFKSRSTFDAALLGGQILNNAIAFILDEGLIWTHGLFYGISSDDIYSYIDSRLYIWDYNITSEIADTVSIETYNELNNALLHNTPIFISNSQGVLVPCSGIKWGSSLSFFCVVSINNTTNYSEVNFAEVILDLTDTVTVDHRLKVVKIPNNYDTCIFENFNTVTSLTNLPINTYRIKATVNADTTLSFATTPPEGSEYMIDILSDTSFTQTLPNSGNWQSEANTLNVVAGVVTCISIVYIHGIYCIRI